MNILLWIAQGLLALILLWVGSMKLFKPEGLPFPWVKEHPGLVLITGIVDLLGGWVLYYLWRFVSSRF